MTQRTHARHGAQQAALLDAAEAAVGPLAEWLRRVPRPPCRRRDALGLTVWMVALHALPDTGPLNPTATRRSSRRRPSDPNTWEAATRTAVYAVARSVPEWLGIAPEARMRRRSPTWLRDRLARHVAWERAVLAPALDAAWPAMSEATRRVGAGEGHDAARAAGEAMWRQRAPADPSVAGRWWACARALWQVLPDLPMLHVVGVDAAAVRAAKSAIPRAIARGASPEVARRLTREDAVATWWARMGPAMSRVLVFRRRDGRMTPSGRAMRDLLVEDALLHGTRREVAADMSQAEACEAMDVSALLDLPMVRAAIAARRAAPLPATDRRHHEVIRANLERLIAGTVTVAALSREVGISRQRLSQAHKRERAALRLTA